MKMWARRIRFLLTISLVASVKAQGYGNLDDDSGPSNQQFGGQGQAQKFPQNQQISSLPQYDSVEQGPAGGSGLFLQPQQQQQQARGGAPWWQGQNVFQRPPGHPGVEQLAPPAQQPNNAPVGGAPNPQNYNPQGNGQPPQQPSFTAPNPPPLPQTTQQPYTNPPPPPPPPPQQPDAQQVTNPPPVPQYTPDPNQYNPPPPPPPPQQPAQAGMGWNAPHQQQLPPSQNYYPEGQGSGQPEDVPGCDLVNKADCHNNRRNFNIPSSAQPSPPPQYYQPPPQYQEPQQQNYQQPQQPYEPVQVPNQGYQPPPPQTPPSRPVTPRPYQPSQNNPYQQNQASSSNFQQPQQQQQQQRPYTPPQSPRPQPVQPQRQQNQQPQEPAIPYPGCPAAMLCVQDEYCNSIGLIEENPIQFSAADRLHRVALMECSEPMTGIVGVCCRDPNYKDPWPDMKKDSANHHHHPANKGHSQGQNFQPPQGNHLQSGGGGGNPYSGPNSPVIMLYLQDAPPMLTQTPASATAQQHLNPTPNYIQPQHPQQAFPQTFPPPLTLAQPISGYSVNIDHRPRAIAERTVNGGGHFAKKNPATEFFVRDNKSVSSPSSFSYFYIRPAISHRLPTNQAQRLDQLQNYSGVRGHTGLLQSKLVVSNEGDRATIRSRGVVSTAATISTTPSYFNPNNKKTSKSIKFADSSLPVFLSSSLSTSSTPTNLLSESKQTLQVLQPCSSNELCLSMSQCHSLNPQFMAQTGLHSAKRTIKRDDIFASGLVQIKRCKYERSGIHYLCCKRPDHTTTSPVLLSTSTSPFRVTPSRFTFRQTPTTTTTTTPRPLLLSTFKSSPPSSFTFPLALGPIPTVSAFPTTKSSLITGFGLRFHSGLHTSKQKEINSRKPNPYRDDEEPIQLISPKEEAVITSTTATPFSHFTNNAGLNHQFTRFTTPRTITTTPRHISPHFTTAVSEPTAELNQQLHHQKQQNGFAFSSVPTTQQFISAFVKTNRTYFSSTTPIPPSSSPTLSSSIISSTGQLVFSSSVTPPSTTSASATIPTPTTTEGKVDISRVPIPVPLRPEIKAEPPVGFIFKGDDLYIPEVQLPAQNFLVPEIEFEERTFPTYDQEDEGPATATTTGGGEVQDEVKEKNSSNKQIFNKNPFLHNNSIEGTTIYSILDSSQETAG